MNTALSALRPYALTLAGNLVAYKQAELGRRRVSVVELLRCRVLCRVAQIPILTQSRFGLH